MLKPITIQQLIDASQDATSLSEFMFKPAEDLVPRRLSPEIHTLNHYLNYFEALKSVFTQPTGNVVVDGVVIPSLSQKLADVDSVINDNVATVDSAVATMQGVLNTVKSDAVTAVNNAINNTAVEGGILADTFVTATAKATGMVARSQREINAERTSIGDFGSPVGDDWTAVIHKAAKWGKPVHFPARRYEVRKDRFNCAGNDILFYGDKGAELVMIDGSDTNYVFDATNSEHIIINGFDISASTASTTNTLLWFNETSYVKELNLDDNSISGHAKYVFGVGSLTQDPFVTFFGFDYISAKFNKIYDAHNGVFQLGNFPVRLMETSDNTVRNFGGSLFSCSVGNGAANGDQIMRISEFVAQNNTATTDTDYWSTSLGTYITFLLCEGRKSTWKGNSIDGLKSREGKSLCDAYLSTRIVIRDSNDIRNIGNFSDSEQNRNIFHFKNDASSGVVPNKSINNDTFIIDKYWLAAIGETDCVYRLANFGLFNGGDVSMKNCTIKVPTLASNNRNNLQSFVSSGNTIEADKIYLRPSEVNFRFWDFGVIEALDNADNRVTINKDTVLIKDLSNKTTAFLTYQGDVVSDFVDVSDNSTTFKNSAGINWLSGINTSNAKINDNTVNGNLLRDYQLCKFGKLESLRNNFDYTSAPTPTFRPVDMQSITTSGSISHRYDGKPFYFRLATLNAVQTGVQNHRVKIEFQTATGLDSILYNFTTDNTTATKKVKFLSPEGAPVELTLATATSTIVPVKTTLTTEGTVIPTYSVGMILTAGEIRAQVLGVSAVKNFKLSIDTALVS